MSLLRIESTDGSSCSSLQVSCPDCTDDFSGDFLGDGLFLGDDLFHALGTMCAGKSKTDGTASCFNCFFVDQPLVL